MQNEINFRQSIFYSFFFLLFVYPLWGQESKFPSDSLNNWPKKLKSKSTWESIVSFPGTVAYLPLKIAFKGIEESIEILIDENRIIPKARNFLISKDGKRGIVPMFAPPAGGGIYYFRKGIFQSDTRLSIRLALATNNRQFYQFKISRFPFLKNFTSNILFRYRFQTNESFFGIGPNTPKKDRSNFTHEQYIFEGAFRRMLSKKHAAEVLVGFDMNDILEGREKDRISTVDIYSEESLAGVQKRAKMFKLQVKAEFDSRNHPGHPSSGSETSVSTRFFREINNNTFGFLQFSANFKRYLYLFYDRVLMIQLVGQITRPVGSREIPFYYLSELGMIGTIRGFQRGRFRDRDKFIASLEYRYPVWNTMDVFLFTDTGQVASNLFSDVSTKNIEITYGGGLRIWNQDGLVSKIDIGKSKDGIRVTFLLY